MILGAQSYTFRSLCQTEQDLRASMRRVADIGYTTVQLSGIGAFPPELLREVCDENGLRIVLTHTSPERILHDTENVIREHEALGCRYIGIGIMPEGYRTDGRVSQFVQDFITPAKKIADSGKLLMYHNHNLEWEHIGRHTTVLDVLLEGMPADCLGITLDTYWVQAAGADIIATLERLADRIHCVHLKDMAVQGFTQRFAPVGEGNIDFTRVLATLRRLGTTEYMLVEQDDCYGEDPFACLKCSYDNVKEMGY